MPPVPITVIGTWILGFDTADQSLDQADISSQNDAGLHGLDGVLADGVYRPLDGDARQPRGSLMEGLHREIDPRCDRPPLEGAIGGHDVECRRRTGIDDQQRAIIGGARASTALTRPVTAPASDAASGSERQCRGRRSRQ